jgi:hypothetical protein
MLLCFYCICNRDAVNFPETYQGHKISQHISRKIRTVYTGRFSRWYLWWKTVVFGSIEFTHALWTLRSSSVDCGVLKCTRKYLMTPLGCQEQSQDFRILKLLWRCWFRIIKSAECEVTFFRSRPTFLQLRDSIGEGSHCSTSIDTSKKFYFCCLNMSSLLNKYTVETAVSSKTSTVLTKVLRFSLRRLFRL